MRKIISDRSREILNLINKKNNSDDKVVELKYSPEGVFKEEEDKKELAAEVPVQKQVRKINIVLEDIVIASQEIRD